MANHGDPGDEHPNAPSPNTPGDPPNVDQPTTPTAPDPLPPRPGINLRPVGLLSQSLEAQPRTKRAGLLVKRRTKREVQREEFRQLMAKAQAATEGPGEKFELAYDAALTALSQQDGTLANLRNRASVLVTVAALITSFASVIGLVNKDNPLPVPILIGLMVAMAGVVLCAFMIMMPKRGWLYGADPAVILTAQGDEKRIRHALTLGILPAILKNEEQLERRARFYRMGILLLGAEVVLVVVAALAYR